MKTPLFFTGSSTSNVSTTSELYAPVSGGGPNVTSWAAASSGFVTSAVRMPCAGTISTLAVKFPTALTQGSFTVTLMTGAAQNAMAATPLSVTALPGNPAPADALHAVPVGQGDFVAWRVTPSGAPTAQASAVQVASVFTAADDRVPIFSYMIAGTGTASTPPGGGANSATPEASATVTMPCAGAVTRMYASLDGGAGAPGPGNSRTVTLRKGTVFGALADTALTLTFGAAEVDKAIDLGGSPVALAAGDLLSLRHTVTGSPGGSTPLKIAFEFVPTVSGEVPCFVAISGSPAAGAARYAPLAGSVGSSESVEVNVAQVCPADLTATKLRLALAFAPGSGKSRAATLRRNGADTALTTVVANTATANAGAAPVALSAGDALDMSTTPTGSPAGAGSCAISCVLTIAEAAAPGAPKAHNLGIGLGLAQ